MTSVVYESDGEIGSSDAPQSGEERPLHVLLLSNTCSRMTGADRDWVTLINALGERQIRVSWGGMEGCEYLRPYLDTSVVARLLDLGLPSFTYLIQENAHRQRSAWLWSKILADHVLRLRKPFRRLRQALQGDPVDLVISNTAAVTLGALFARFQRLPHLWCIKESLDTNVRACCRLAWWITRMSSAIVVPSQAVAKPFPRWVKILPDGSNVKQIRASAEQSSRTQVLQSLSLPLDLPVVAQIGGLVWWKGQHVTAETFVRLASKGGKPSFSLLFLGEGSPDYRRKLVSILASAPREWQDVVRFVCFDPGDFSYVAASDIVVHPSVLPDPFPNAVREAMILGKPVIASWDGGIPEMIQSNETGVLVQPGNPDELVAALSHFIRHPEERFRIAAAAQRFACTHFDIQARKQAFSTLFRDLADVDPRRGRVEKRATRRTT